jgi:hypothetical protein
MQLKQHSCLSAPLQAAADKLALLGQAVVAIAYYLSSHRAVTCLPGDMEHKAEGELALGTKGIDAISRMQVRTLKADASPLKKNFAKACSQAQNSAGFEVWLHIYDLGPLTKWFLNGWHSKESGLGAFHVGVEVLGVEWSFQAMIDCESEEATGVMCHPPKAHPRHVYRESVCLGSSALCANDVCNVLARLEKQWPARSYHFLSHNCTDFAEALALSLNAPNPFPAWAHGLAKGLIRRDGQGAPEAPWWIPTALTKHLGSCGSRSCASECCSSKQHVRAL